MNRFRMWVEGRTPVQRLLWLTIVLLGACAALVSVEPRHQPAERNCSFVHKPPKGCPAGWAVFPKAFKDAKGFADGCVAPPSMGLAPCVDVLYPGETLTLPLFEISPEKPKGSDDKLRLKS